MATEGKQHLSIVICGHVDSGKSTSTGRLLFELGGIKEREMQKLREEAEKMGKGSFAFAFYMDKQKEERERGVTITCATKEFFTDNYHYTIIDAPGHSDFIKNMISGSSQADIAVLMVPADGNFTTSIQKGNHKEGEIQGQTRQHAKLLNLLGVSQLIVCVNKMDCKVAKYSQARFEEIKETMQHMLIRTGWPKKFVQNSIPIIPISGWIGDNLIKPSDKMPWWKGCDVMIKKNKVHVHTLLDALNNVARVPKRKLEAPLRMPVSGILKIKGIGDVITGRVEQGALKPGQEIKFLPTNSAANPCEGKVFSIEMHHKPAEQARPGDNVGINVKGLVKGNMPKVGDIITLKSDESLGKVKSFTALIHVVEHPNEIKTNYTPIAFVRTNRSAVKLTKIIWAKGKSTGGKKVKDPVSIKTNDSAEVIFEPQQPFVVEEYDKCSGLARVAILDGNTLVMLGKVTSVEYC